VLLSVRPSFCLSVPYEVAYAKFLLPVGICKHFLTKMSLRMASSSNSRLASIPACSNDRCVGFWGYGTCRLATVRLSYKVKWSRKATETCALRCWHGLDSLLPVVCVSCG